MRAALRLLDHYRALGIASTASTADIKKAFLQLSKVHHPDVAHGPEDESKAKFQSISEAYKTLSNPQQRRQYDLQRMGPTQFTTHAQQRPGFYSREADFPETSHHSPYKILSNTTVLVSAIGIMVAATIFHFAAATSMTEEARKQMDEHSALCAANLEEAQARARDGTVHDQLARLRAIHGGQKQQ